MGDMNNNNNNGSTAVVSSLDENHVVADNKSKMFSVYVRFRPLNEREKRENGETCIEHVMSDDKIVVINGIGSGSYGGALSFKFDRIFYEDAGQNRVFEECVQSRLETFIASTQDCNILSYGQTSSGKTWTIDGTFYRDDRTGNDITTMGIMPRTLERLCTHYGRDMSISCYEIYCEKIFDLLRPSERVCKFSEINDAINIDVEREQCRAGTECSAYEYYARVLRRANKNRHFASTAMNSKSSRSHTFIEFICPTKSLGTVVDSSSSSPSSLSSSKCHDASHGGTIKRGATGRPVSRTKIFRIIDLAGSERATKTQAKDQILQEGININNSLMYLKQMVEIISHRSFKSLPKYRDSKLTRIIYSSIKNNDSSVVLLLCCSPSNTNANETISTLRFGSTATKITKLTTLTRDEAPSTVPTIVYADGISPLESEKRVREERERNLAELQRLERRLGEERERERRDFERRLSAYESQIEQLSTEATRHPAIDSEGDTAKHRDREFRIAENNDDQLDILRVTRETYEQCRHTIELQRNIIDELTSENRRLQNQIQVYDLFKTYMLAHIGESELSEGEDNDEHGYRRYDNRDGDDSDDDDDDDDEDDADNLGERSREREKVR